MADILDAAQTSTQTVPADTGTVPPTPPPAPEPVEPPPVPITDVSSSATIPPPPPPASPDSLIVSPPDEEPVPPPPAEMKPEKPKKKINAGLIITGLLLILVTLPLTVFYVSQSKEIANIRSLACDAACEKRIAKDGNNRAVDPVRLKVVEKEYNKAKSEGKDAIAAMRPAAEQSKIDTATTILKQSGYTNPTDAQTQAALDKATFPTIGKQCGGLLLGGCGDGTVCGSNGSCSPKVCSGTAGECGATGTCGSAGVCVPITNGVTLNGSTPATTPGTSPTSTYPQPSGITVTFNCGVFTGNARALCLDNNDYAKSQVNTTGKIPTVNSLDPDAVANMIAGASCPATDTKCKESAINTILTNMRENNINGLGGTPAPGLGPISCAGSGYSGFEDGGDSSKYVSEPCPGGGYLIERIATRGCPSGQTRCWCSQDRSNCTTGGGNTEGGNTPPTSQCISVRVYDAAGTTALTSSDLAALHAGDTITLGYTASGNATKVHFKINTEDWRETTTKVGSEFRLSYTLENLTSFNITAQWFDGTAWH